MKKIFIKLYDYLKLLWETFVSLISIVLFTSFIVSRKNSKFRKSNIEDVHILANGPSLKDILENKLEFLKNNDTLAVNFFANNPIFFKVKPKYYVLLDPGLFFGSGHVELSARVPVMMNNLSKVTWEMTLYVPYSKTIVEKIKNQLNNSYIKIMPFCPTRVTGFKSFRNWAYKHNLGLPSSKNVLLPSILLMLNRGYKRVYLYGAEFSWTKTYAVNPENGKIYTDDDHFYDMNRLPLKKGQFKFDLSCLVDALDATDYLAEYADYISAIIINRTPGSFIDAFVYENPETITLK